MGHQVPQGTPKADSPFSEESSSSFSRPPSPPPVANYIALFQNPLVEESPELVRKEYEELREVPTRENSLELAMLICGSQCLFTEYYEVGESLFDTEKTDSASIENCRSVGNLSNFELYFHSYFDAHLPLPGILILIDIKSGKLLIRATTSLLEELRKFCLPITKPVWERSLIEQAIFEHGKANILAQIVIHRDLSFEEILEIRHELCYKFNPDLNPSVFGEAMEVSKAVSYIKFFRNETVYVIDDFVLLTLHDSSERIAVTSDNKTRNKVKTYTTIEEAQKDIRRTNDWFSELVARFGHEPILMRANSSEDLDVYVDRCADGGT